MTIWSHAFIRRTFEQQLPACAKDRAAAIEATADRLSISTKDVEKALAETAEA